MFVERNFEAVKVGRPRRLVHGIGVNDAPYPTTAYDKEGKEYRCPFYTKWRSMIERVACKKYQEKYPTYKGCTIDPSWLMFSKFRAWMETKNWQGRDLDKDLKVQGNKHYGPDTCLFIPQELNKLLCVKAASRGEYPLGVSSCTIHGNKYITAFCSFYGKHKNLGYFKTVEEASTAYKAAKLKHIRELADTETDPEIKAALLRLN